MLSVENCQNLLMQESRQPLQKWQHGLERLFTNIIASDIFIACNKICLLAKKRGTEAVHKHALSTTFLLAYSHLSLQIY